MPYAIPLSPPHTHTRPHLLLVSHLFTKSVRTVIFWSSSTIPMTVFGLHEYPSVNFLLPIVRFTGSHRLLLFMWHSIWLDPNVFGTILFFFLCSILQFRISSAFSASFLSSHWFKRITVDLVFSKLSPINTLFLGLLSRSGVHPLQSVWSSGCKWSDLF